MNMTLPTRHQLAMAALVTLFSSAQAQTTWTGFEGTSQKNNLFLNGAFRVPDTMGAAGTTQYLESTNGSVTVYDKSSGAVLSRVGMSPFWASKGQSGSAGDQRVLFDLYTNRWIMNGFCANVAEVCIAVSDTDNALGTWKTTKISAQAGIGVLDYPTLSVTQNGVLIGTNNFSGSTFLGTSLFSIPKADLFGGAPTVANMSTFTTTTAQADRGFTIQGATNWQGNTGNSSSVFTRSRDQFDVFAYRVNGVNAAVATQTAVVDLDRPGYVSNNSARQPDILPGAVDNISNRLVDTLDDRVSASVYEANGKIYGIHTVTPTGVAAANAFTELRYYVIDAATLTTLSQGTISGGSFDYYQGSLAVNSFGDVVIGFNRSGSQSADLNVDGKADGRISFMGRVLKDNGAGALSQVGTDLMFRVSDVGDYRCGAQTTVDTLCRQRWGDYAAVTLDPGDPYKFWAIGEYAAPWDDFSSAQNGSNIRANWHTYIAAVTVVPEPATYALMALGLGVVGIATRRRRGAA